MIRTIGYYLFAAALLLLYSCSSSNTVNDSALKQTNDERYDSEFPSRNASKELEEISNTIRMINSIAFYESYIFPGESKFKKGQIHTIDFEKEAAQKVYYNNTASGTGTIISKDNGLLGLITVAHIVSFPDTVVSYFVHPDGTFSEYVQSVSVKSRQTNYVPDFPGNGELEIFAMDKEKDLALLGKQYPPDLTIMMPVFNYKWGSSEELEWGDFVYVFGFPMNFKVLSRGIVSSLKKESNTFLIDAVFNKGCSGGIVLAIRDGVPNFELVGLVKSVPAEFENYIRPLTKERDLEYSPLLPYKGDVYVDKEQILRMGITKVIGIEIVKDFLKENQELLLRHGFYFKDLFNVPKEMRLIQTH
jgi:S1-C subfamily serine protease